MKKRTVLCLLFSTLAFFMTMDVSKAQAETPVLLFSDLESGPKTGWEGSANRGAAVTVWGHNLGPDRGDSYITVNGAQLTSDTDYAEWGAIGPARGLERITFWLNSNCQDGAGTISVTIDGTASNALPFMVREGTIYFIAKDGSDGNNGRYASEQGGGSGPWLHFYKVNGVKNTVLNSGDIIYVRSGTYNDIDEQSRMLYYRGGAFDLPLATVGYPGEWPVLGTGVSKGIYSDTSYGKTSGIHFHKLICECGEYFIRVSGSDIRFVGIILRNQQSPTGGMIHLNPSWDTKILGCLFKDSGYDAFKHTIYINNEAGGHEASNIEIAWNELDNVIGDLGSYDGMPAINIRNAHSSLQVHDLYIHDNLMKNSPSGTFFWSESYNYNVYIWNNINYNVAHTCTGSVLGNILFWAGRDLYIWNNVFYNVGNVSRGISMIRLSGSANVQSANNIFYSVDNQQYIRSYGTFVSTNDIYYGNDLSSGSGINTINPLRVDPRFVSISGPDFHLQPTSPAIDAGVPAVSSIVTKDYDGNPRPMDGDDDGSAEYDIGAYEYTSGYIPPLGAPSVIGITPTNDTTPSWTWSSGGGGNGTYRYKLDNSDLSSGATQTFNTTYTPDTVLSEGPHTLYVQERDGAGNWSSSGSFTIVIDTTEPSTPVITTDGGNGPGADYSTTDSSITLEGSCTGDTVTIYVNGSTDGIAYTSGETSWTYTGILESGENTFNITAEDAAGNLSNAGSITITYSPELSSPKIAETLPHDGAGINDDTRVPNDTSFAVLIEDPDGIDTTDAESIMFTISDGVNGAYTRDLSDTSLVRVVKVTEDEDISVTKLWAVYDRFMEDEFGNYDYGTQIDIKVEAKNRQGVPIDPAPSYIFEIESETQHDYAQDPDNLPDTGLVDTNDPALGGAYNKGFQVNSGDLEGAKIVYDRDEPAAPRFGPSDEIPSFHFEGENDEGVPVNLQPFTVFNTPVKIFIPFPGSTDVSDLSIFLYKGTSWVLACDSSGTVQPGGDAWMVPGSRVNHNNGSPSTVEMKVYHFSAVQAGISTSGDSVTLNPSTDSSDTVTASATGGGCFVATAAYR